MRQYYVYILASRSRNLYIGVTNDIYRRIAEHRSRREGRFTTRYRIERLVYVEVTDDPVAAIQREKQLKKWRREKKLALIAASNPSWTDLADGWPGQEQK
jgi:putative endonuclease